MKKIYLCLLSCLVAVSAFSAEFTDYVLREGFEQGIPATWTQENVSGNQAWIVEDNTVAEYPAGAFEGTHRAALRNDSQKTIGFTTRLVSPVMDLSGVYQPILVFAHAQQQRTGDYEHLKVYYRTSATSDWVLLKEYTDKIAAWQQDTISLVVTTETYQIAFETTDAMGRGVVLDDVRVRPKPTCEVPSQIKATMLDKTSCQLTWTGSFDSEKFEIILATETLSVIDPSEEAVVYHTTTPDFSVTIKDLELNTEYFGYIKAYCDEETDWTSFTFKTPNIVSLPYVQTFDLPYHDGYIEQSPDWYHGTDLLDYEGNPLYLPYINTNTMTFTLVYLSHTATTGLIFSGAQGDESTYIPGGHYVYAASPELDVQSMKNVEVQFWGTSYWYQKAGAANGITVGVMSDPTDLASFTPIQTVYNRGYGSHQYYQVSFKDYEGTGKHIAFVSQFKQDNVFFIDEVSVTESEPLNRPTQIKVNNPNDEDLVIEANIHGADSWNLILSKVPLSTGTAVIKQYEVEDGTEPLAENQIMKLTGITGNTKTIKLSELDAKYKPGTASFQGFMVFVQAVKDGQTSLWSLPVKYRVVNHVKELPVVFDFEDADDLRYQKYSAPAMFGAYTTNFSQQVPASVILSREEQCYGPYYMTGTVAAKTTASGTRCVQMYTNTVLALSELPTNVDMNALGVEFYTEASSATYNSRTIQVGIMTDPYDERTFDIVGQVAIGSNTMYTRQYVPFTNYSGSGHYLAFRVLPLSTYNSGSDLYASCCRIDKITVDSVASCSAPIDINAELTFVEEANNFNANISWSAPGMEDFVAIVSTGTMQNKDNQTVADTTKAVYHQTLHDSTNIVVEGLTALSTYYYSIGTICDGDTLYAGVQTLTTGCPDVASLPYKEDFESYKGGSTSGELPNCWTVQTYSYYGIRQYPYISTTASQAYGGKGKSLYFSNYAQRALAALPYFGDNVQSLELTFQVRAGNASYVNTDSLVVGVMTDPEDESTFEKVAVFRPLTTSYQECVVDFDTYKGEGKYIAFYKPRNNTYTSFYYNIDNVVVDKLADCRRPSAVTFADIHHNGATMSWKSTSAANYQVLIMKSNIDPETALVTEGEVLLNLNATTNTITFKDDKLGSYTTYYAAVRGLCGDSAHSDWSSVASFKTTCDPVTVDDYGVETFSSTSVLNCWTIGLRAGTIQKPTVTNGYLYLYSSANSEGSYAAMPEIQIDSIKHVQISFDAHAGTVYTDTHILQVGVVTDPTDMATGVVLKTLKPEMVSGTTKFEEAFRYTVRFTDYAGDYDGNFGTQPYFTTMSDGVIDRIYIDNLTIDSLPEVLEPVDVEFAEVGRDQLKIQWEKGLGNKFEVKIATSKLDDPDSTGLKTQTVQTNECTVTGLEPLTTYYIYVRTIKGDEKSAWSNVRWTTTECPASTPMPYVENFDSYTVRTTAPYTQPGCWKLYFDSLEYQAGACVSASAKMSGTAGLLLTSKNNLKQNSFAVLPAITDSLNNACIKFSYKTNAGAISNRYLYVGITTVAEPFVEMTQGITWIDSVNCNNSDVFLHRYVNLGSYQGKGKHIVLAFIGGDRKNFATNAQVYVDDISSEWEVAYYPVTSSLSEAKVVTVTEPEATLDSLSQSTSYNVQIRTKCSASSYSEWTAPLEVETYCLVPLAESNYDFEGTNVYPVYASGSTVHNAPKCWLDLTDATSNQYAPSNYGYIVTNSTLSQYTNEVARSGEKAFYLLGNSGENYVTVLPEVDGDCDTLQLRFYVRMVTKCVYEDPTKNNYNREGFDHGQSSNLYVGIIDNPADISNITNIYTYTCPEYEAKPSPAPTNDYWDEIVIPLYGMNGKYIVFYSNDEFCQTYIDDLVYERVAGCPAPSMFALAPTSSDTALDITWKSAAEKWNVKVLSDAGKTLFNGQVLTNATVHVSGVEGNTSYTIQAQAVCDTLSQSNWTTATLVSPCAKVDTVDASWDFEKNLEKVMVGSSEYTEPACWSMGAEGSQGGTLFPTIVTDGTDVYSRHTSGSTGGLHSLRMPSQGDACYNAYAILPETNFEINAGMMLHFYARLGQVISAMNGVFRYNPKSSDWANDIVVGYTIGDDFSTFQPCDTVFIEKSYDVDAWNTKETDRADRFWDSYLLPLDKYTGDGHRICIVYNALHRSTCTSNVGAQIDDVEIIPNEACVMPFNLGAEKITAHTATLVWDYTSVADFTLQVALDDAFQNKVVDTVLKTNTFDLTGLQSGTKYYVRAQHNCLAEQVSDWSDITTFITGYAIRFSEKFAYTGLAVPENWAKGRSTTPQEAFTGTPVSGPVIFGGTDEWNAYALTDVMTVGHMACQTYGNYSSVQWLFTPVIDLSDQTDKKLMLSFDLTVSSAIGVTTKTDDVDDELWVLVSTDNGNTWKEDQSTVWSNNLATAAHKYAEIPVTQFGRKFYIDMTKYVGQSVKIAFVSVSKDVATHNYLHLANVQLNSYVDYVESGSLCQYEDYVGEHVTIDASLIQTGHSVTEVFAASNKNGKDDELVVVTLDVEELSDTQYETTVCQGTKYEEHGFVIDNPETGVYKQKLQSSSALGCDSIVELSLVVLPTQTTDTVASMCAGSYVEVGGQKFYTSGVYKVSLSSLLTGCDSIVNLYLTITEAIEGETDVFLCPGTSYQFGDTVITTAGTYKRTLKNPLGCDSIATIHVAQAENYDTRYIKAICHGETYSDEHVSGLSQQGDYKIELKSVHGCDSIVTLHLLVASEENIIEDVVTPEQLPYIYDGKELIAAGSTAGKYSEIINTGCGLVTLNVTVVATTALQDINVQSNEVKKVVVDHRVFIYRNGGWYDVLGNPMN